MGSTVVSVVLDNKMMFLANVGDSRAYVLNGEEIRQVSWDHSFVGELVRQNLITPAESLNHPKRNVLTMSISAQRSDLNIYTMQVELTEQDVVVLCSDGLWGPVSEMQIQAVALELPPQKAADKLIELANRNQGPDNISVIIARHKNNRTPDLPLPSNEKEDTRP
jgi:protein phosphatase